MNYYFNCLRHYAKFSGRATCKEFWMFTFIDFMILTALTLPTVFFPEFLVITGIYVLATILPRMAVTVRRLHDTGHSGWNMLAPGVIGWIGYLMIMATKTEGVAFVFGAAQLATSIYLLVLLCLKSEQEENCWGKKPTEE